MSFEELKFKNITDIPGVSFYQCISLKHIENLLYNIQKIGNSAFNECTSLLTVTISSLCVSMNTAFYRCTSLLYIKCLPSVPPNIGYDEFSYTNNCYIYVPDNSVSQYKSASFWSSYSSRIKALSEFTE